MKIKPDEVMEPMPDKYKIQNEDAVDKSSDDPLSILKVFERLEIGPVKLEPKRLIAPYPCLIRPNRNPGIWQI